MPTLLKWLIMLVIWFLFSLIAYQGCIRECCPGAAEEETTETVTPADTAATRYAIDTQWGAAEVFTNDGYDALRDRLAGELAAGKRLVVTGLYYESEPAPEGFANMGFARADRVVQLLAGIIPAGQMKTMARALQDTDTMKEGYFSAVNFSWEDIPTEPVDEESSEVVELDDRIVIRFPFRSAVKEPDPKVDEYLNKLAERLQQTEERVSLVGHTDNVGTEEGNKTLGMRRANYIRDILVQKGVDSSRITTESKGLSQPVDSNETPEGRQNNRRVELRILGN